MPPDTPAPAVPTKVANVTLRGQGLELNFQARVPAGPTLPRDLLPLAHALADLMADQAAGQQAAAGRPVSCSKGCGACCRSLIAVSRIEARQIAELVAALPPKRRAVVEARLADAQARLQAAGLLAPLQAVESWQPADYTRMVGAYFALGIACPFLEDESCSIYAQRPLACREFLVTSPPVHCGELASPHVVRVALPIHVFNAVARWQAPPQGAFLEQWVPMILAREWAAANPDTAQARPGLELLQELLTCMADPEAAPGAA